jgi:GNAT superfamily N-acetyltransferase
MSKWNIFRKTPVQVQEVINPLQKPLDELQQRFDEAQQQLKNANQIIEYQTQLIEVYKQMVEPNTPLKIIGYTNNKQQTFIVTKEAPDKLYFSLYIPEQQCWDLKNYKLLQPLAEVCALTKDNKVTIENLNVHPDHLNMRYGAYLLAEVLAEVKSRGFKLIDGKLVLPNREEESLRIFLSGNFIGHVCSDNKVILKESKL